VAVDHPSWARLEDQLSWYDAKSIAAQKAYKRLKVAQLFLAAAVPVLAAVDAAPGVIAGLGGAVLITEGLQQLGQFHTNWLTYRSTCESLKHEKYLFLAHAGPYVDPSSAERVLAERVESLVSQEHASWAAAHEQEHDRPSTHAAPLSH
jgi:hypothetical protein